MKQISVKKGLLQKVHEKDKDALRKKEGKGKKASKECKQYVCPEKYKRHLQNDRIKPRKYEMPEKAKWSQYN